MAGLAHPDVLTDGVVTLRRWREDDVSAVACALELSEAGATAWVARQIARSPAIGVSCAVTLAPHPEDAPGAPSVGYVGLIRRPALEQGVTRTLGDGTLAYSAHPDVVGIGYWVAVDARRHGVATRAAALLARWGLRSAGLVRVEALIDPRNTASRRVVERAGFVREGHLRAYLRLDGERADALVYSLLARDL